MYFLTNTLKYIMRFIPLIIFGWIIFSIITSIEQAPIESALKKKEADLVYFDFIKKIEKPCLDGNASICYKLSKKYGSYTYAYWGNDSKQEIRKDIKKADMFFNKAIDIYTRECDNNKYTSCNTLGYIYFEKRNIKSIQLFEKTCNEDIKNCNHAYLANAYIVFRYHKKDKKIYKNFDNPISVLDKIINKYHMKLEIKGTGSNEYSFYYSCKNISRELTLSNLRFTTYYDKAFQLRGDLIPDSVRDIDYISTGKPLDIKKALALTCEHLLKTIPIQIHALENR